MNDPLDEIYKMMDMADLTPSGLYNPKKSMARIVNDIRTKLATELNDYIKEHYERKK